MSKWDEIWPFNDRKLAIPTTVFPLSIAYISVITFQIELKFVNNSYFKELFQNLRPKEKYSKNIILVTSHFGTLCLKGYKFKTFTLAFLL